MSDQSPMVLMLDAGGQVVVCGINIDFGDCARASVTVVEGTSAATMYLNPTEAAAVIALLTPVARCAK